MGTVVWLKKCDSNLEALAVAVFGSERAVFEDFHPVRSTESATWLTKQCFEAQNSAHFTVAGDAITLLMCFSVDGIVRAQTATRVGNKGSRQAFTTMFRNTNSRA